MRLFAISEMDISPPFFLSTNSTPANHKDKPNGPKYNNSFLPKMVHLLGKIADMPEKNEVMISNL